MYLDDTAAEVAHQLKPLVAPVMNAKQLEAADISIGAGEGYEALKWLLDFADDPQVRIPSDLLDKIRACVTDDDIEEYAPLLAKQFQTA